MNPDYETVSIAFLDLLADDTASSSMLVHHISFDRSTKGLPRMRMEQLRLSLLVGLRCN